MLTDRDILILKHVENFGFITIEQAKDMFFKSRAGYDTARRRLKVLVETGHLKTSRNNDTNENIFYIDNFKNITLHSMLLMNYYCKLIACGATILEFKKEKKWDNGRVRSDGFCVFTINDYTFYQLIEVVVSKNDMNLVKYESIYATDEVQQACRKCSGINSNERISPTIVVIDKVKHNKPLELPHLTVITIEHDMSDIGKIFV